MQIRASGGTDCKSAPAGDSLKVTLFLEILGGGTGCKPAPAGEAMSIKLQNVVEMLEIRPYLFNKILNEVIIK